MYPPVHVWHSNLATLVLLILPLASPQGCVHFLKLKPVALNLILSSPSPSPRAVFGEVYPDPVRVVCVGRSVDALLADPKAESNKQYSVEFCGGTHLSNTKEAGAFALISEEGECVLAGTAWVAGGNGKVEVCRML